MKSSYGIHSINLRPTGNGQRVFPCNIHILSCTLNSRGNSRGGRGAAEVNGGINNRRSLYSRGVPRACVCVPIRAPRCPRCWRMYNFSLCKSTVDGPRAWLPATPTTNITRSCVSALPRFERRHPCAVSAFHKGPRCRPFAATGIPRAELMGHDLISDSSCRRT